MARRSVDIRKFAGDLRSHFTALLIDSRSGKVAIEQWERDGAPWGVMAAFDHALAKTLLDALAGSPEARPAEAVGKKQRRKAGKAKAKQAAAPAVTESASAANG